MKSALSLSDRPLQTRLSLKHWVQRRTIASFGEVMLGTAPLVELLGCCFSRFFNTFKEFYLLFDDSKESNAL